LRGSLEGGVTNMGGGRFVAGEIKVARVATDPGV